MRKPAISLLCSLVFCSNTFAATDSPGINLTAPNPDSQTVIDKKVKKEDIVEAIPFGLTFYKQNYIIPYYYTGSPDYSVYKDQMSQRSKIMREEIKYQLSLKVPIWKKIMDSNSSIYFGYTQLAYWQAYNTNAFFRETDFQPEIFVTNQMSIPLAGTWTINTINIGASHQSNGFGNVMERSWNRVYAEAVASSENWMVSVKPWYVIHDATYNQFNPDLADYLGYGEITVALKFYRQVITLQTHGLVEQGGRHATALLSYTFPMTKHINGFLQVFSGYGQSLIEYNHRTNSAGMGIAFSNLI